jgi:hypothetical protein
MEKIYLPMVLDDPQAFKSIHHLQGKLFHSEDLCIEFINHVVNDLDYCDASEITIPVWSKELCLVIIYVRKSLGCKSRTEVEDISGLFQSKAYDSILIPGDKIYFLRETQVNQIQFGYPQCDHLLKGKSAQFDYHLIIDHILPCYFDSSIQLQVPIPIPQ